MRFLVALLSVVTSAPVFAADSIAYVALDFGQADAEDRCYNVPTRISCKKTSTASRIAGGFQLTPTWGAEFSSANYNKTSIGVPGRNLDWEASGMQLSGTGTFPMDNLVSIFGKLGVARTKLKLSVSCCGENMATSTKLAFGFGVRYELSRRIAMRAQYDNLGKIGDNSTGMSRISLLSAGAVFKF